MGLTRFEVLGIGAPLVDHTVDVSEEWLAATYPGGKGGRQAIAQEEFAKFLAQLAGKEVHVTPAGCTVNLLKGLACMGHTCKFVGKIGKDGLSSVFSRNLKSVGITLELLPSALPTARALCLVTPDGERTLRTCLGAAGALVAAEIRPQLFKHVRHVHIEGYSIYCRGLIEKVVDLSKKLGLSISLDLGSFDTVEKFKGCFTSILRKKVDVVFGNAREACSLTGASSTERACMALGKLTGGTVAVTEGARGAWVTDSQMKTPFHCDAEPINKLVDSTGAGDAFASAFLHGYLCGLPAVVCARFGAKAGALVVQVNGAELPKASWKSVARCSYA